MPIDAKQTIDFNELVRRLAAKLNLGATPLSKVTGLNRESIYLAMKNKRSGRTSGRAATAVLKAIELGVEIPWVPRPVRTARKRKPPSDTVRSDQ